MSLPKKLIRSFSNIFKSNKNSIKTKLSGNQYICCGLVKIVKGKDKSQSPIQTPIPLISVNVFATVVHAVAEVEVTQVYANREKQPIETIYYFPVNPNGAVTNFEAELEGRIVKGNVKPHDEAIQIYDDAIQNQFTSFLGEETKADIFKLRVGFLKPGSHVKVTIEYITEVKNEPGSNAIRFYIPTTIAPRYVSPTETDEQDEDIKAMKFCSASPAPLSLQVAIHLQGIIKSINCPTHDVKIVDMGPMKNNPTWERAIVELVGESSDMDRDFVLHILPEEVHKPRLYIEKVDGKPNVAMVHFIPSFTLDEQKTELVFVLDRSGSMTGKSIELAKKALLIFLHSMPADCYFNVVGFGSTFRFLFEKSVKYDDENLRKAKQHAKTLQADLGGTEILAPLLVIYGKPIIEGYKKQIFVLTDGQVSNTDCVVGIVKAYANDCRAFALGIGDSASYHLVEGIAKAGGGTSAFVTYNERIDRKVLNQLKNGLQPSLSDVKLEWEGTSVKKGVSIDKEKTLLGYNKPIWTESLEPLKFQQIPNRILPIYDGSQLIAFGLFKDAMPNAVTVKALSPDGSLSSRIELSPENNIGRLGILHRLAAVKLIRELEQEAVSLDYRGLSNTSRDEEDVRKEIIQISCENGVTSKYTCFVAVDAMTNKPLNENWVMQSRNVPTQFAHGWHGKDPIGIKRMQLCAQPNLESREMCCLTSSSNDRDRRRQRTCVGYLASYSRFKSHSIEGSLEEEKKYVDSLTPLEQLISFQSFDGSFCLNDELCKILGRSLSTMKQDAKEQSLQESVFATAIVIAHFTLEFDAEKDVWELVVVKAKKWLQKQNENPDEILKSAEFYLKYKL